MDTSFTLPLQDYFLMQHTDNVWGNVLINQNSSSLCRHIFSYWMLSTGHLHANETNSYICLIIWKWKLDCDIEVTAVIVLCTLYSSHAILFFRTLNIHKVWESWNTIYYWNKLPLFWRTYGLSAEVMKSRVISRFT